MDPPPRGLGALYPAGQAVKRQHAQGHLLRQMRPPSGQDFGQLLPQVLPQANHGALIGTTAPNWKHCGAARPKSNAKKFTSLVKMTTP